MPREIRFLKALDVEEDNTGYCNSFIRDVMKGIESYSRGRDVQLIETLRMEKPLSKEKVMQISIKSDSFRGCVYYMNNSSFFTTPNQIWGYLQGEIGENDYKELKKILENKGLVIERETVNCLKSTK